MQKQNDTGKKDEGRTRAESDSQDLAKLFNYPAIGELFSGGDTRRLDEICSRFDSTRENLERIVRHGRRDEAESAARAIRGIEITLEFLQNLQNLRLSAGK